MEWNSMGRPTKLTAKRQKLRQDGIFGNNCLPHISRIAQLKDFLLLVLLLISVTLERFYFTSFPRIIASTPIMLLFFSVSRDSIWIGWLIRSFSLQISIMDLGMFPLIAILQTRADIHYN
uniref:Uncharacterized protein n=1 Tax=Glossina austeni TaxID=7395 RepID=A0A1A9VL94_GLOAU